MDVGSHPHARLALPVLAMLYALGFTNLFLRSSLGVLAPDLKTEMALTPEMLSTIVRLDATTTLPAVLLNLFLGSGEQPIRTVSVVDVSPTPVCLE